MQMAQVSIYGGTGFVGGVFNKLFLNNCLQGREEYEPQHPNLLNFISTTDNYNVYEDPFVDIDTNLNVMLRILEAARKKYGSLFVFNQISSWFVYGNTDFPATEISPCHPTGFYSITKRASEELLISYCETYGIHYRILRMANVLGIEDKGVSAKKNALQFMIRRLVNDEPIGLYNGGVAVRDYIDVRDAAFAINLVLNKGITDQIYNISNGVPIQIKSAIDLALKFIKRPAVSISDIPTPSFHRVVQVENMYLDNSKLRRLGYHPRYSLEETISRIVYAYDEDKRRQHYRKV